MLVALVLVVVDFVIVVGALELDPLLSAGSGRVELRGLAAENFGDGSRLSL